MSANFSDSEGTFSDQIDAVLFDRQYSPFIFHYEGQTIAPAESVYAVFGAKQTIKAEQIDYAQKKIAQRQAIRSVTAFFLLSIMSLYLCAYV